MSPTTTGDGILEDIVGAISGGAVWDNVPTFRRPIKGSPESRERMAKIRGMRKMKGNGILGDIAHVLIHTGLPFVGSISGNALGGPAGGVVGSVVGNVAGDSKGNATGYGLKHNIHTPYGQLLAGVPVPIVTDESVKRVKKHGYRHRQKSRGGFQILGGSFLSL